MHIIIINSIDETHNACLLSFDVEKENNMYDFSC